MKIGRWIAAAAAAVFLYFMFAGDDGIIALFASHRRVMQLESEIISLNGAVDSLHREMIRLKEDTLYIERIAREKLGMARKDETVYKFIEKEK